MVKSKLPPRSGCSREAVEPHPQKGAIKFWFFLTTDSPLQKSVCIFLRNKYFGNFELFIGKRVYFNVKVSKNKTFFAIKCACLCLKNWKHFLEKRM